MPISSLNIDDLPREFKLEHYERKFISCKFDRPELVMKFRAGRDGIGAIFISWIDAILDHDSIVKKVEEKMDEIDHLKRIFRKYDRLFRNWSGAWNYLNSNPEDYNEYLDILPRMQDFEERIKIITDAGAKARALHDHNRFILLDPLCSRILAAQKSLAEAEIARNESRKAVISAETELNALMEIEKKTASRISDDHVVADERKIFIGDLFPNIISGYIVGKIDGFNVESLPFQEVMYKLKSAESPCNVSFRRYDYKYDPVHNMWKSLAELRDMGVHVEDPRVSRATFVRMAADGEKDAVELALLQGEDPDAFDYSGCSALHVAAVHQQEDIVDLLYRAGAAVDSRDKNMMTPLLACAKRGLLTSLQLLLRLGADVHCSDRLGRNALYLAVCSGNRELVRYLLSHSGSTTPRLLFASQREEDSDDWTCNQKEFVWGWTALHAAANRADLDMTKMLISHGASIYRVSKAGQTAEEVAREAGHGDVFRYLRDLRIHAPAQLAYRSPETGGRVWIGTHEAMEPKWVYDVGVSHVLCIQYPFQPEPAPVAKPKPKPKLLSRWSSMDSIPNQSSMNSLPKQSSMTFLLKQSSTTSLPEVVSDFDRQRRSMVWLADDEFVTHEVLVLDMWDGDDGEGSWDHFRANVSRISDFIQRSVQVDGSNILICDPFGNSTSPACVCVHLLLRRQMKVAESILMCMAARPSVRVSLSLRRGLEKLQQMQEDKKLKRLRERLRNSPAISCAF